MPYEFFFCDPVASFAAGSPGRQQRRIIDGLGHPHLGVEVWEMGRDAYEMLRTEDGRNMTLAELQAIPTAMQPFLEMFFTLVEEKIEAGTIGLVGRETALPMALPIRWQEASWDWQIGTITKLICAFTDYRAELAVEFSRLPAGETFQACQLLAVLHLLDEAVLATRDSNAEGAVACVHEAGWLLDQVKTPKRVSRAGENFATRLASERASKRATSRHAKDPKRGARDFVKERWQAWRRQPTLYKTAVAFAKDMLDKFPEVLTSEAVITRWVRFWDKERAEGAANDVK